MRPILVTAPTSWIVTLDEAKAHCRVDFSDEDSLISSYLAAAQAEVENILGRALTEQVWRLPLDTFPSGTRPIRVPRPPLVSIDTFTYYDSDNVQQNLTGYTLDSEAEPALIYPPDTGWPSTYSDAHPAVSLKYTCGHDSSTRPTEPMLKQIILVLIGRSYEQREAVITGTIISDFEYVYRYLLGHGLRDWTDYSDQE